MIVFIHQFNDLSGSPQVLSNIISLSKLEGIKYKVYLGNKGDGILSQESAINFGYIKFKSKILTLFSYVLSQFVLFFKLLNDKDISKKDTVLYVNTLLPFGAAIFAKIFSVRVVYHVHEVSIKPRILHCFLVFICRNISSTNIYVSKFHKSYFSKLSVPSQVVYNCVSGDIKKEARVVRREVGKFNVIMICSLKKYKGINEFVDIATKLQNNHIDFHLVVNSTESEVYNFINKTELPNNIKISGPTKDIGTVYEGADLLLNLSIPDLWTETFGLTILEAMCYSIPCIVPEVGGPAEIVEHGYNGYLLNSMKTDEICKKIILLSRDEKLYSQLASNAYCSTERFSKTKFNENILEIIKAK